MKRIAIHSVPRSGSTWLGSIFDSCPNVAYRFQPLFSYGHKSQLGDNSSIEEIDNFFNDILNTKDEFVLQIKEKDAGLRPDFEKNDISAIVYKEVRYHYILDNLLKKDKEIIVIGLVRNPLSVINSWLRAPKEFKKELGWKELEEWRYANKKNLNQIEEFNGFEKWKEVTLMFEDFNARFPNRFYLLKYSDLLNNTLELVQELFNFCGLEYTQQTETFLLKSSSSNQAKEAYSVYRKSQTDDKWKEQLNIRIRDKILREVEITSFKEYLS